MHLDCPQATRTNAPILKGAIRLVIGERRAHLRCSNCNSRVANGESGEVFEELTGIKQETLIGYALIT